MEVEPGQSRPRADEWTGEAGLTGTPVYITLSQTVTVNQTGIHRTVVYQRYFESGRLLICNPETTF